MNLVRLQKYLADKGLASRRKAEEYILAGLISVNGKIVTQLGTKVNPELDKITWDTSLVAKQAGLQRYIMLNKPAGIVTTCAEHLSDKTVVDLVDVPERIFPIGRLDKDTTGLLILTTDGRLTQELMHPSKEKEKEYEVTVDGNVTYTQAKKLESGVVLFGEKTAPTVVRIIADNKLSITLTEGKNRQVRRICRKVGLPVIALRRVRINNLWLPKDLTEGKWRELSEEELERLRF